MNRQSNTKRAVAMSVVGTVAIIFLVGADCKKPTQQEVDQIGNDEAKKRACGSLDINTVSDQLTTEAKANRCFNGFVENQTAAICNASNPPPAASWVCTKCEAPKCETEPENCSVCGASLKTDVKLNIAVNIRGHDLTIKGNVKYSAKVNFQNIIAKVRGDNTVTGTQPAFTYWSATTDATSTREAAISGSVGYSGVVTGSVNLDASFECAVGVNFRGGQTKQQNASTCKACESGLMNLATGECGCTDGSCGGSDAGTGSDAGSGSGSDAGSDSGSDAGSGSGSDAGSDSGSDAGSGSDGGTGSGSNCTTGSGADFKICTTGAS